MRCLISPRSFHSFRQKCFSIFQIAFFVPFISRYICYLVPIIYIPISREIVFTKQQQTINIRRCEIINRKIINIEYLMIRTLEHISFISYYIDLKSYTITLKLRTYFRDHSLQTLFYAAWVLLVEHDSKISTLMAQTSFQYVL